MIGKKAMGDYFEKGDISVPKYGFKVKLNNVYPEKRNQRYIPSIPMIIKMLPMILRYLLYYIKTKWSGKYIEMDYINSRESQQIYGVPIGGIGCGTIGRGYRGEFCRFQMRPGLYEVNTVEANQFIITVKDENNHTILQSLLSNFPKKKLSAWTSTIDSSKCTYTGLYPRSWTEYDLSEYGIKLVCRQISPVIPHDYDNSCLPCAVFVWSIQNISSSPRTVTIAFTFKNGTGSWTDSNSTCSTKSFSYENTEGVILHHTIDKMQCSYALATKSDADITVSKCLYFDPNSDGSEIWDQLSTNGEFDKPKNKDHGFVHSEMACGIATKVTVPPQGGKQVDMNLVWEMPTINFINNQKSYNRFYTKQFGTENAVLKIVSYAFENYQKWEESIENWQKPVLDDENLPDWYKGALFNETYFVSDGGTLWLTPKDEEIKNYSKNDPRRTYGHFAYLEGQEYLMYNSYDVHFYASHALHKNWPLLQKCLQYDLRDFVSMEIGDKRTMLYDGEVVERKVPISVPHDAGNPGEEALTLINAYNIHDVSKWKDLNPKFILQTYRDAFDSSGNLDKAFVQDMYDICNQIMQKSIDNDMDDDGLIENGGKPDQTFDAWVMTGVSAYCGGLWLAALYAMISLSDVLGKPDEKKKFQDIFDRAQPEYENKLWNGLYYEFDSSTTDQSQSIMADQLCGHWYLRCCGIESYEVFPKSNVRTALNTIYKNNVQSFCNGEMGAVNGFLAGKIDETALQSLEAWTGVTYALAATMIHEGMVDEGFKTAGGMYQSMVYKSGLAFDTPEALYDEKYIRALAYMRPLSIWSMQIAWEKLKKSSTK
ncbi:unnamed protein product [Phaedon cochleariae]|uniref:Non-lysosomal glucosylceramidase n=1 Tax=Phaedon cochleariae TaxID=80249 RepID=A0A9N9SIT8_PHACE|nr:unnamed protein product [Phaedon cochleariae]